MTFQSREYFVIQPRKGTSTSCWRIATTSAQNDVIEYVRVAVYSAK